MVHSAAKAVDDASEFPVSRMENSSHLSPPSSTGVAEGSSNVRRREADAGIRLAGDGWVVVDDHVFAYTLEEGPAKDRQ